MKKLLAVGFLFICAVVCVCVYYSPLTLIGSPEVYEDNAAVRAVNGLVYGNDDIVRVDIVGVEEDMYVAIKKIGGRVVKTVSVSDRTVVYAYSDRVCAKTQKTQEGEPYNIMASCDGSRIAIGTPVLSGSY